MVRIESLRKSGRDFELISEQERDSRHVLQHLIAAEFAFGGRTVEASRGRLVVQTKILSHIDRTIYTGSVEDMEILLKAAAVYEETYKDNELIENQLAKRCTDFAKGSPLLTVAAAGIFNGHSRAIIAMLVALEVTEKKRFEEAKQVPLDDLLELVELSNEMPELSYGEILEMAGGATV